MSRRVSNHIRSNVVGYVALFFALSGGAAWATHPGGANTISSGDIINGEVKNDELAANAVGSAKIADRSVKNADLSIGASSSNTIADRGIKGIDVALDTLSGEHIAPDSLTGTEIDESTLSGVPSTPTGPAGGDLAGTYPNPTIGTEKVTPDKIGSIPAVRADNPQEVVGLFCSGGQVIPGNGTLTPLNFTTDEFDTANMHVDDTCTDPNRSRVTAPRAGVYQVGAAVVWDDSVGGTRFLGLRVNGNNDRFYAASRVPSLADIPEQSVSTLVLLFADDYVEALISQNSGSPVSIDGAFERQHLAMHWVGPG